MRAIRTLLLHLVSVSAEDNNVSSRPLEDQDALRSLESHRVPLSLHRSQSLCEPCQQSLYICNMIVFDSPAPVMKLA